MAKNCYKEYLWLIDTLDGKTNQSKNDSDVLEIGLQLETLKKYYAMRGKAYKSKNQVAELLGSTLNNWRMQIWFLFGLIIEYVHSSKISHRYRILNPELLDEGQYGIRGILKMLSSKDDLVGELGYTTGALNTWVAAEWKKLHPTRNLNPGRTSGVSMGFVGGGSSSMYNDFSKCFQPASQPDMEKIAMLQFSMMMGESLIVDYRPIHDDNPWEMACDYGVVFQPHVLKEIEGRWYAIGFGYYYNPIRSNLKRLLVYNVENIYISDMDDDFEPIHYELIDNFSIEEYLPSCKNILSKYENSVVEFLFTTGLSVEDTICPIGPRQAQVFRGVGVFQVYANPSIDLLIQYLAHRYSYKVVAQENKEERELVEYLSSLPTSITVD